jgi:hypothetical protein
MTTPTTVASTLKFRRSTPKKDAYSKQPGGYLEAGDDRAVGERRVVGDAVAGGGGRERR